MSLLSNDFPISTVPNEQLVLFLICEELKSRRFFDTMQELGLDNSHYQPHLDDAILTCLGFCDDSNETFDFYYAVMEKYARKIDSDRQPIKTQALLAYQNLVEEKNRRDRFETGL